MGVFFYLKSKGAVKMQIILAVNLRHEQKIKDLEEKTVESFKIICRKFEEKK